MVRLSMPASRPRVRAACPDVDAPITRCPAASKASRTQASAVVLPAPATPTTSSIRRPDVVIARTASAWPSVSRPPSPLSLRAMAASAALDGTAAAPVASTPLRNTVAMAASTAMTDAGA